MDNEKNRKIKDAGVKIPFAKKFRNEDLNTTMYSEMTDVEKLKLTKKANIWKTPNYIELKKSKGWTDKYTAIIKVIRDNILPAPALGKFRNMDDNETSLMYIDCITKLKEVCLNNNSVEELSEDLDRIKKENPIGFYSIGKKNQFPWIAVAYKASNLLSKGFLLEKKEKDNNKENNENDWLNNFTVSKLNFKNDESKNGYYVFKKSRGRSISLDKILCREPSDTKEEAIRKAKIEWDRQKSLKKEAFKRPHLKNMGEPEYSGITPDDLRKTFGFRGVQFGRWLPDNERQIVLDHTYTSLMNLAKVYNLKPSMISLGGELGIAFGARGNRGAVAHYEPEQNVINLTRMSGSGALAHEWFHAFDKYLYNKFGNDKGKKLRYMTGDSNEKFNNAEDIRLGMYMSGFNDNQRIALQKLMVTVFAREEKNKEEKERKLNIFYKYYDYKLRMNSDDSQIVSMLNRQKIDTENSILSKDNESEYYKRSTNTQIMPSASKLKYYGSKVETMARAFEASTDYLLKKNNIENKHLVSGVDDMTQEQVDKSEMFFPYPIQEERKNIATCMQNFVNEISPSIEWKNTPEEVINNKKIVEDKQEIEEAKEKPKEIENLSLF